MPPSPRPPVSHKSKDAARSLHQEGRGSAAEALLPQGPVLPTFFFFFRMTFTPSTDTMRFTFFFLIFLALNSYCGRWKRTPELAFLCQDSPREGQEGQGHVLLSPTSTLYIHARTGQGVFLPCSAQHLEEHTPKQSSPWMWIMLYPVQDAAGNVSLCFKGTCSAPLKGCGSPEREHHTPKDLQPGCACPPGLWPLLSSGK